MPCNSDYMEPSKREKHWSKVLCFLDELDGKPLDKHHWEGYHPTVYGQGFKRENADSSVAELCSRLQGEEDVTKYSLEMQIWWRDHQEADRERIEHELQRIKEKEDREAALAKLSDYERGLLGVKE